MVMACTSVAHILANLEIARACCKDQSVDLGDAKCQMNRRKPEAFPVELVNQLCQKVCPGKSGRKIDPMIPSEWAASLRTGPRHDPVLNEALDPEDSFHFLLHVFSETDEEIPQCL